MIEQKNLFFQNTGKMLPTSPQVNVGKLEQVFSANASSYKYFLLRALLQLFKNKVASKPQYTGKISFAELEVEMLVNAWFPVLYFKLNLGKYDKVTDLLKSIQDLVLPLESYSTAFIRRALQKEEVSQRTRNSDLTRYAPNRLLTPWFVDDLTGLHDWKKDPLIKELSNSKFDELRPLYRLLTEEKALELHYEWMVYFTHNLGIVEGWLDMQWLRFLQRRNPNVPALGNKLWFLPQRIDMKRQRDFWRPLIASQFHCIYTNSIVDPNDFALDHFLPRAWVGHDQLWNLVPTNKSLNSSKGMNLPPNNLIQSLAKSHFRIIEFTRQTLPGQWHKRVEDYELGLNVSINTLINQEKLYEAFKNTVGPQMKMAKLRGFPAWKR